VDPLDRVSRPRVELERPGARHARDFIAAAVRSRMLHRGRVTAAATPAEYRAYLGRCRRDVHAYFVVTRGARELIGVVEILDVAPGLTCTGRLGYYAFMPYAGRGLMREGVALALQRAFAELALDGLEAEVQKGNRRSVALLERLGFQRDGDERKVRKVGRRWLDHERWVLPRNRELHLDQDVATRA
jgi:ribosomal-protein-alanine N-acetyltransferase